MTKVELMDIISPLKPEFKTYQADEAAKAAGHSVIRLPPYHCELNPIELVWAQVKRYAASHNTTFKMDDVRQLFYQAFDKIQDGTLWRTGVDGDQEQSKLWANCVRHVIKEEAAMCEIDGIAENVVERLVRDMMIVGRYVSYLCNEAN